MPGETREDTDDRPPDREAADLGPEPPSVSMPETDPADVDPAVRALFWKSVFVANVALFCLLFGPMLVFFTGAWVIGGATVLIGVAASLRLYHLYLVFQRRQDASTAEQNP